MHSIIPHVTFSFTISKKIEKTDDSIAVALLGVENISRPLAVYLSLFLS